MNALPSYYIHISSLFIHYFIICTISLQFFLKDKKPEYYVDIFRIIDIYCLTYNNVSNLKSIYVDFEIAIHNAINDVWPFT